MNRNFFTGYDPRMKDRARELRREMTRQERHLWYDFLRDYPIKCYRQRSIDRFQRVKKVFLRLLHLFLQDVYQYTRRGRCLGRNG